MPKKKFRIRAQDIQPLVPHTGGCIATDRILVDGRQVGYLYRERPDDNADTGWRFMAGDETDEYLDDAGHHGVYALNTIANYDRDIIPLLDQPIGSAFVRSHETGTFEPVESPVGPDDSMHSDFPIVSGVHQLNAIWSVSLPVEFNWREEEGSLILWRPGITSYFNVWSNDHDLAIAARVAKLRSHISPEAIDQNENQAGAVHHLSYRLVEDGLNAFYSFAVGQSGHLQVAVYFDDESDMELVRSLILSITENQAV